MTAAAILADLDAAGLAVRADAGDLVLTGATANLTPELRARIVAAKADLLRLVAAPPLPPAALPLWTFDLLHPLPDIAPIAPPPDLTAAEIASEVARGRAAFDRLVSERIANPPRPRPTFGPCVRCGTLNWYQDGAGTWRCGCCTPRLEGSKA